MRGDYRQAIAYHLQCTADTLPEDVDLSDYLYASRKGVGSVRWWDHYQQGNPDA